MTAALLAAVVPTTTYYLILGAVLALPQSACGNPAARQAAREVKLHERYEAWIAEGVVPRRGGATETLTIDHTAAMIRASRRAG